MEVGPKSDWRNRDRQVYFLTLKMENIIVNWRIRSITIVLILALYSWHTG